MITAITIENFKGIGRRVEIPLKPITLLFGPNSAGKSTILHAIHYAREILERRNLDADRTLSGGEFVDLGGFRNFVHNHDLESSVVVGFEMNLAASNRFLPDLKPWDDDRSREYLVMSRIEEVETARVELTITYSHFRRAPFVSRYRVEIDGKPLAQIVSQAEPNTVVLSDVNRNHAIFAGREDDESLFDELHFVEDSALAPSRFIYVAELFDALPRWGEELLLNLTHDRPGDPQEYSRHRDAMNLIMSRLIVGPGQVLLDELRRFRYVGPLRQTPPRNHEPPRSADVSRWATGLAAWDALKNATNGLVDDVSSWLSREDRLATGYEMKLRRFRELDESSPLMIQLKSDRAFDDIDDLKAEIDRLPERRQLILVDRRTGINVEPEDVGEGIAQIVPVVVAALSPGARLIAIEQPELHVHPRVQVALGDLFIQRANEVPDHGPPPAGINPAGTLLIETHSEHLLLRLLRRIRETAEGTLPELTEPLTPDELAVLYVEPGEAGTTVKQLRVSTEGDFIDKWPDGFFEERAGELF
jgi:hypothetical protein